MQSITIHESSPIFMATFETLDTDKLKLLHLVGDEWVDLEVTFKEIEEMYYTANVKFDSAGVIVLKVTYDDTHYTTFSLRVVSATLEDLIDAQLGNWSIENNQMIFYRTNGEELMRFNLYDKDGHLTTFEVMKRERV